MFGGGSIFFGCVFIVKCCNVFLADEFIKSFIKRLMAFLACLSVVDVVVLFLFCFVVVLVCVFNVISLD